MRALGGCVLALGLLLAAMPGVSMAKRLEAVRLEGLALLREPAVAGSVVRALRAGDIVTVVRRQGAYVEVLTADGAQGYVHGGFLTGFDDIAPMRAYAAHMDATVRRPVQEAAGANPPMSHKPVSVRLVESIPQSRGSQTYTPVADGGGLPLFISRFNHPSPSAGNVGQAALTPDFNARKSKYAIEVHLSERKLYLYENLPNGSRFLLRDYVVAVPGREMEAPQGWGVVTGITFEPWWHPTSAMKARAHKKGKILPDVVKPGVRENPMGTFKIILSHGYGFRIHGNNNPRSIGRPVTSGCIRMRNDEGRDMAKMIDVGTEVVFLE